MYETSLYKSLKCITFGNPEKVKKVLVLIHGYGSDANDLISIVPNFKNFEDILFISPNAPYTLDGLTGRQWFSLNTKINDNGSLDLEIPNPSEVITAYNLIIKLIEEIQDYHNLTSKNISLFGFSQGGILSLYTALHSNIELGSVISHSGIYFGEDKKFNHKQKILMIHGEDDDILSVEKFNQSVEYLSKHNVSFESHIEKNLAHSINKNTIEICKQFLLKNT